MKKRAIAPGKPSSLYRFLVRKENPSNIASSGHLAESPAPAQDSDESATPKTSQDPDNSLNAPADLGQSATDSDAIESLPLATNIRQPENEANRPISLHQDTGSTKSADDILSQDISNGDSDGHCPPNSTAIEAVEELPNTDNSPSDAVHEADDVIMMSDDDSVHSEKSDRHKTKSSKQKTYAQKSRTAWTMDPLFKDWLEIDKKNSRQLQCKYCRCSIQSKKSALILHIATKKHAAKVADLSSNQSHIQAKKIRIDSAVRIAEARLALLVASHTSINAIDHFTKTMQECFTDSAVALSVQLCRTKCAAIISNVWYPFFRKWLRGDIAGPLSLILDESTDIADTKFLGIVIKYFSLSRQIVLGSFLKLQELDGGDSDAIVRGIKTAANEFELNLQNCVGIGTDNASVMVGRENGVFVKLQREIKHLILVPCICHSLQLAISEVVVVVVALPVKNVPYHLQCNQRWTRSAHARIMDQWTELETHFRLARTADRCFTANQLFDVYTDLPLKSYLYFLKPHLKAVQRVNKLFQSSSSTDMSELFHEICFLIEETASVITVKQDGFDALTSKLEDFKMPNPNLGYEFELHIEELLSSKIITSEQVAVIRNECVTFITHLVESLRQRVPTNIKILRHIKTIAVKEALRAHKDGLAVILRELNYTPSAIAEVEAQWQKLTLVDWAQKKETATFWAEVRSFKDAGGNNPFHELSDFACKMLTLPFSNAEVERVFSQLNLVKNKLRNRMQTGMVNAIVMIRASLKNANKCCEDFPITNQMVGNIGTMKIYNNQTVAENDMLDLIDADFFN